MRPFEGIARTSAAGLLVLTMLVPASPAAAQKADATPTARELWREYPLNATPEPGSGPAATPEGAAHTRPTAQPASSVPTDAARSPDADERNGASDLLILIAAAVVAAVAAGAALVLIRRRKPREPEARPAATLPGPGLAAPLVSLSSAGAAMLPHPPRRLSLAASNERHRADGNAGPSRPKQGWRAWRTARQSAGGNPPARSSMPPDPTIDWTAEIEWRHGTDGSCFCLTATRAGSSEQIAVGESGPLTWPPTGPDAVQELRRAVERLESAAVAAGWEPAQTGDSWYSKRFRWQSAAPVKAAPPSPAPAPPAESPTPKSAQLWTGRFKRPSGWPEGTENLYRCEVMWEAGYVKSHFHFRAMVFRPGRRRGVAACSSKPFKWPVADQPDPESVELRAAAERLADAMTAAGWEPAGKGTQWYSQRFVWRREGPPPERVDVRTGRIPTGQGQ